MHLTLLLRNYCFFGVSPIFLTQYPVMLRDTAGEKVRMFLSCCIEILSDCNEIRNVLYSSSAHECAIGEVSRSDGGVGFYQNLFSCFLTPLLVATAPLFLPYILRCKTQGRRNSTNSRNKIGYPPLSAVLVLQGVHIDRNRGEVGILLDLSFCVSLRGVYKERASNRQLFLYG